MQPEQLGAPEWVGVVRTTGWQDETPHMLRAVISQNYTTNNMASLSELACAAVTQLLWSGRPAEHARMWLSCCAAHSALALQPGSDVSQ